jgi:anion-transporting  ArsA/GET3 family ATPase
MASLPITLPRLIFITGKGGTGKSTVAAALATALATRHPTILADLDRRRSAARLVGAELDGAAVQAGKNLHKNLQVMALTPRAELEAFIERIVPLKMVSRRMLKSRTFGYVTAALPGLEAFLMLERLRELAGQAALHDRYVVIDAPATGTALELLSVARGVKGIAPLGTLNHLAAEVEHFLGDPERFGVVLTLTPEELALRETLEAATALAAEPAIARVAAILSGVPAPLLDSAELAAAVPKAHARLATRRLEAAAGAAHARAQLERAGMRVIELPMVFAPALDAAAIGDLSRMLAAELLP